MSEVLLAATLTMALTTPMSANAAAFEETYVGEERTESKVYGGMIAPKTTQTYTKVNTTTGQVYSGRTSGYGSAIDNVAHRDTYHHMNAQGYEPAVLDKSSSSYEAIRGREQMLIDYYGGAQSIGGSSGNAINGIGANNTKGSIYMNTAIGEFGIIE